MYDSRPVIAYLTGTAPMERPNSPHPSRHVVISARAQTATFAARRGLERIWTPLAGVSWLQPLWRDFNLIHSFNAIPLTSKPWLVTFESMLPRTIGPGGRALDHALRERLLAPNCRALLAMSAYARGKFAKQHAGWSGSGAALAKVSVLYPHVPIAATVPIRRLRQDETLRLVFVGNDFARKGGIVALRAARQAVDAGMRVHLDIVSRFRIGRAVYVDHTDRTRYDADLQELSADHVTVHGSVTHDEVLTILSRAHVQVLATLDDTFGYSVIEGYSVGTPAITTNVCAMPELVRDDETGAVVQLPIDAWGNWTGRNQPCYRSQWELLDATYTALATQVVERLATLQHDPTRLEQWSLGAVEHVRTHHDAIVASRRLDDIYEAALRG